tara:strand:- start:12324 stop:13796 length:1473 start_codon:yes stop_codon:yes gene_type:complete
VNDALLQAPPLNTQVLSRLDEMPVKAPGFERSILPVSVLHFGPGAFFRAHQMDYFDRLNAISPKWGVVAVALRSRKTPDALANQNGLYTLVTLDEQTEYRLIGSLIDAEHIGDPAAFDHFLQTGLKLITLTITEKGYCLDHNGELDLTNEDIAADLQTPDAPVSAIGWLVKGLKERRESGLGGLVVLSCDNLPSNGRKLKAAILKFAQAIDPELADWIENGSRFPSSMVDSITPATDEALIERVKENCGYADAWPIQREAFTSWVIERVEGIDFPPLDEVGAILTDDVSLHEQAKLRLLNGAHSTLAYLGLAFGYGSVAEGMRDPDLTRFLRVMMTEEILPSLAPPEGLDLQTYIDDLLRRFRNPAIQHKLSQIAWDGSKKLPIRLLDTVSDNLEAGRPITHLCYGVAAWMRFIVRMTRSYTVITDPMADELCALAQQATDNPEKDSRLFLRLSTLFGSLAENSAFQNGVEAAYADLLDIEKTKKFREVL